MPYAATIVEPEDLRAEEAGVTIMAAVLAFIADHVMGMVASTRRNYLAEFNEYLDDLGVQPPRRTRRRPV